MLSLIRFLYCLYECCGTYCFLKSHFSTDNQGLLKHISNALDKKYSIPNDSPKPDWDAVEEIIQTIKLLPCQPKFSHVKGHQEDSLT